MWNVVESKWERWDGVGEWATNVRGIVITTHAWREANVSIYEHMYKWARGDTIYFSIKLHISIFEGLAIVSCDSA
jgi:hypothetical protein